MLKDIVSVEPIGLYRLRVRFEDGIEGVIDLASMVPFSGVFEPLKDPAVFERAFVNPDLGTVCWPNGADLDPDVLYDIVVAQPHAVSMVRERPDTP